MRISPVPRVYERQFYLVVNRPDKDLVTFFATFLPVQSHFLILDGEFVKIFAIPFSVKIDACGEAFKALFVQPFDAFKKRIDVFARNRT